MRSSLQGILQHLSRAIVATPTAGAGTELLAQLSQTGAAFGDCKAKFLTCRGSIESAGLLRAHPMGNLLAAL
jgi:hypothetical protein